MATLQERRTATGEKRYRVLVRLRGFPTRSATFRRKTDARRWAQKVEAQMRERRFFPETESLNRTVEEVVERYSNEVLARKRPAQRRDQSRHLKWWRGRIGRLKLAEVTASVVKEERQRLVEEPTVGGKRRTPATVNRYMTSLSHAFTLAVREWEWMGENPLRRVRALEEPRGRVRVLSDDERERLLQACRKAPDRRLYPLVVLALSTGARRGELLKLRWEDVDLERGVAVLHQTKNKERRALPLHGLARQLLERDRPRRGRTGESLVFESAGERATFPRWSWERAVSEAGLRDLRFHDLRHTAASYLAMSGATLTEIADVLGHKTLQMVKRYAHLTEQHTSRVVERMNRRLFGTRST